MKCEASKKERGLKPADYEVGHSDEGLAEGIPLLEKEGWLRHQKNIPVPLTGADGVVIQIQVDSSFASGHSLCPKLEPNIRPN